MLINTTNLYTALLKFSNNKVLKVTCGIEEVVNRMLIVRKVNFNVNVFNVHRRYEELMLTLQLVMGKSGINIKNFKTVF